MQQVAIAVGVALAGGILEIVSSLNGGVLTVSAFHLAFFVIAAITAFAIVPFLALPPNAGEAVSGHAISQAGGRAASPVRR
jgi:hypothetical protein